MKPLFSIVVPCCDVEPYVRECLASVAKQSFRDWECLIGIETSKDRTEEVIREITVGDERFRIFNGPRSGSCSASRNTGVDMARGEYVIYLDGDDSIADESLARLAAKINARPGADLYQCTIAAYDERTGKREFWDNFTAESPSEMTGVEAILELTRLWGGDFCQMLQITIFRREFQIEHDLKCIYGLRKQDQEVSPRALYRAKRVVPLHEPFYLYRIRPNSVSTAKNKLGHFYKDFAIIFKSLLAFYATISRESDFDPRVVPFWLSQCLSRLFFLWFYPFYTENISRQQRVETLQQLFADGFGDFDLLLKCAKFSKRILGWWVRIFVCHPRLRRMAELFFECYYRLCEVRGRKRERCCLCSES